jgi:hypothetical protein
MKQSKILTEVIEDLQNREKKGVETYGTTLDRKDLTASQWIVHLREELQDAILYLKKLEEIQNDKVY